MGFFLRGGTMKRRVGKPDGFWNEFGRIFVVFGAVGVALSCRENPPQ